jgi:hypothetical protein
VSNIVIPENVSLTPRKEDSKLSQIEAGILKHEETTGTENIKKLHEN